MGRGSKFRRRAALLLTLVGGLGFVAGLLTDRLLISRLGDVADTGESWPGTTTLIRSTEGDTPSSRGVRVVRLGLPEQLAEDLDLTPEQRAELEEILAEDQARLRAIMDEFEPALSAVIRESRQRVERVLTEDQLERWRESPPLRVHRPPQP